MVVRKKKSGKIGKKTELADHARNSGNLRRLGRSEDVLHPLYLFSGNWEIRLREDCKEKTSFLCRFGTLRFEFIPFGLMNAPSTFQIMMDHILARLSLVPINLDDVVVFSDTIAEHFEHLKMVIKRVSTARLKLKVSKCFFVQEQVDILVHVLDADGVRVDEVKVQVIQEIPRPRTATELCS